MQDRIVKGGAEPDPMLHPIPPSPELTVVPRSTAQVLFFLANGVEVPIEHVQSGVAQTAIAADGQVFDNRAITHGLFEVHATKGHKPPCNAYVAVRYRGYWYYLDDRDQVSKTTFALMLQLARMDFGRPLAVRPGPVLTLPAGR